MAKNKTVIEMVADRLGYDNPQDFINAWEQKAVGRELTKEILEDQEPAMVRFRKLLMEAMEKLERH
jgi:hypothetical protein